MSNREDNEDNPFLIVCDGTIGCGKTTFLDEVSSSYLPSCVRVLREPVAQDAENSWWGLLVDFYNALNTDGSQEAVMRLENVIWTHHESIATQRSAHAITERSCDSSVLVFCRALCEDGILSQGHFEEFKNKLDHVKANACHQPTLILYFRIAVEEALGRIQKRAKDEGRFFEEGIDRTYLEKLHSLYENLYKDREDVIVIDSNAPTDEIMREAADRLQHNFPKYCRVLEGKGFHEAQTSELLKLIIRCFRKKIRSFADGNF